MLLAWFPTSTSTWSFHLLIHMGKIRNIIQEAKELLIFFNLFFNFILIFFHMFTNNHAFSRIVHNVLYIFLESNKKDVEGRWMGYLSYTIIYE